MNNKELPHRGYDFESNFFTNVELNFPNTKRVVSIFSKLND